ncbi:hypothetical protein COS31_04230 [Candidatus Roizmanbacteria bacterium CG02_land_8_20_14_3_00_36_15]|uniref:Uncharacterized protein n=2 Tax=Candidatus Roizmaniibacteriota TaxID=1752723 RepID=A0A2M8KL67_9BACT|nr:MAG: hypothetical protein COS31_04230 [Candidatus Roizmanbacteria bacterium CG02_land_8_20_14_3_00_36_15]PIY69841.1 MAG: hypothetical protein COY89_04335 [Candidatus Roizmanbacteria bacterium CG_4_10_14_0_8_um_filter_36_36]PJA53216.1 MAG: hypothetical protein CO166_02610 [Candidatus Roizmanbacteria bacterium CG_4_9_14_3_um_filter_36_11]PJC81564.1 MAG: hypothetical protein CO007_03990 [Candidatus Roizmanbacteria bacterium CG_4_8_14_3_um_filter_36_10]PJE60663.1 MAG: hypothetical protein COU86_
MKKLAKSQFTILLLGTFFAWGNFSWELIDWLKKKNRSLGCAAPGTNPFLTPCFYGAIFLPLLLF